MATPDELGVPLHHYYGYNREPWIPDPADSHQPEIRLVDSYFHNCSVAVDSDDNEITLTFSFHEPIDLVNITINTVPINPSRSSGPQPRYGWRR